MLSANVFTRSEPILMARAIVLTHTTTHKNPPFLPTLDFFWL